MPAHPAKTHPLVVANARHSPSYGCALRLNRPRFGGLLPEYRAIGIRLEGHSQLLLRARSGGPMVYYRTKF